MEVAASTIVKFGAGADSDAMVVFELDPVMNVDDEGNQKTSFGPGDDIFLRLHHDSSVQLERMGVTHGQVDAQGAAARDIDQEFLWASIDDEHELKCIPDGNLVAMYYGNEATGLIRSGDRKVVISGGVLPARSKIIYFATFSLFRVIAPNVDLAADATWPLDIVAYMEATP